MVENKVIFFYPKKIYPGMSVKKLLQLKKI